MKFFFPFLLICFFFIQCNVMHAQQNSPTYHTYQPHVKGDTLFAFFSNTHLYKLADSTSKIIVDCNAGDTLFIAEDAAINYQSDRLPDYYKVKHRSKIGYVKSADLALARFENEFNQTTLLIGVLATNNQVYFSFKTYYLNQLTFELLDPFYVKAFEINITGNRGLEGIEKMVQVDFYAEACGEGGGIIYYNWTGGEINYLAHVSDMSDGGVYWQSESFVFPKDSGGVEGKVFFTSHTYELTDEENNWEINTKETRTYNWMGDGFNPPFKRNEDEE